jgi:hypothetical protein
MEAIKLVCGFGEPLKNRLLRLDLRTMRFDTIRLNRHGSTAQSPRNIP